MPLYEYQCRKCGHRFERIESASASAKKKCPQCRGKAERLLAAPAIQFKGSGWYVTDYAAKSSGSGSAEGTGDGSSAKSEKPADKSADAKAEPKPGPTQKVDKVSDRKRK
jgi:putative FmdB family regulatory protein